MDSGIHKQTFKISFDGKGLQNGRLSFDFLEGKLKLIDKDTAVPKKFLKETYYEGSNKTRIRSSHEISHDGNIHELASFTNFDLMVGLDTSPLNINGENVSITSAFFFQARREENGIRLKYIKPAVFLEFRHGNKSLSENVTWKEIIEKIVMVSDDPNKKPLIGIITDCNQGNHSDYNSRHKPIINDFFLPEGFTLFYAKDKGKEVSNQIIKACDKRSKNTLKLLAEDKLKYIPAPKSSNSPYYSHSRIYFDHQTDVDELFVPNSKLAWIPLPGAKISLYGKKEDGTEDLIEEISFVESKNKDSNI